MQSLVEDYLKDYTIEQLMNSQMGEELQKAIKVLEETQKFAYAFLDKQDELEMSGVKAVTLLTFEILKKIGEGQELKDLSNQEWKDIAKIVADYSVLMDDQQYSVFVFSMYEKYIRYSANQIQEVVPERVLNAIYSLADELALKKDQLENGEISEVSYIEDCMWISLEAMIKLLASSAALTGNNEIVDRAQAIATFAFEYGRMMLFKKEQEIVTQFIESQYQLDKELQQKFDQYLEELKKKADQFNTLIENAFSDDFREMFLHSIALAKAAGVEQKTILTSIEDIDDFFLA